MPALGGAVRGAGAGPVFVPGSLGGKVPGGFVPGAAGNVGGTSPVTVSPSSSAAAAPSTTTPARRHASTACARAREVAAFLAWSSGGLAFQVGTGAMAARTAGSASSLTPSSGITACARSVARKSAQLSSTSCRTSMCAFPRAYEPLPPTPAMVLRGCPRKRVAIRCALSVVPAKNACHWAVFFSSFHSRSNEAPPFSPCGRYTVNSVPRFNKLWKKPRLSGVPRWLIGTLAPRVGRACFSLYRALSRSSHI